MSRQMVWLSGVVPYQQASEILQRFGYDTVPPASIWRRSQYYGEKLKCYMESQQDFVRVERIKLPPSGLDHRQSKGISMDGGMVNIRGEGWKEMKVGTIFDVDLRLERDKKTHDLVQRPHAANQVYTAVLGSVEEFAPAFWVLAVKHHVPQAADSSVSADGASWIWNLTADYFPDSVQILDWYHACEHLAKSAHALFPDDPTAAQLWFRQTQTPLFLGSIDAIILELESAGLEAYSRYFHTHKRRMTYLEFSEMGYPIGSGTVESGVKQFKARLTASGMRWSRPAAQRMLVIRSAVLDESFDDLWATAA